MCIDVKGDNDNDVMFCRGILILRPFILIIDCRDVMSTPGLLYNEEVMS